MDKNQAINLISDSFNSKFDEDRRKLKTHQNEN